MAIAYPRQIASVSGFFVDQLSASSLVDPATRGNTKRPRLLRDCESLQSFLPNLAGSESERLRRLSNGNSYAREKLIGKKVKLVIITVQNPQTGDMVRSLAVSPKQQGR
jgi:hypothetical protein